MTEPQSLAGKIVSYYRNSREAWRRYGSCVQSRRHRARPFCRAQISAWWSAWKDADPDIPVLIAGKAEYDKVRYPRLLLPT